MSGVVPASATEVFRNERRERSSGVMVKTACLVEVRDGFEQFV